MTVFFIPFLLMHLVNTSAQASVYLPRETFTESTPQIEDDPFFTFAQLARRITAKTSQSAPPAWTNIVLAPQPTLPAWAQKLSNSFKNTCPLSIPMGSDKLFVQKGIVVDFTDVAEGKAGNLKAPYCTLSIGFSEYDRMVSTGKVEIETSSTTFERFDVDVNSEDFFGTSGVSLHYNISLNPSPQTEPLHFTDARCFVPKNTATPTPFTLSDIEHEFTRLCSAETKKHSNQSRTKKKRN